MTDIRVHQDADNLRLTITGRFDAPVARVWQLWEDPRKLERWWGPPTYPATVVEHDLTPGGRVGYFMTGPEGDRHHGWWRVIAVAAPHRMEAEDGFADDDGNPNPDMPTTLFTVTIGEAPDGGTSMTIESTFPSREVMEQMAEMGMVEGMQEAMGQIDAILAEEAPA